MRIYFVEIMNIFVRQTLGTVKPKYESQGGHMRHDGLPSWLGCCAPPGCAAALCAMWVRSEAVKIADDRWGEPGRREQRHKYNLYSHRLHAAHCQLYTFCQWFYIYHQRINLYFSPLLYPPLDTYKLSL